MNRIQQILRNLRTRRALRKWADSCARDFAQHGIQLQAGESILEGLDRLDRAIAAHEAAAAMQDLFALAPQAATQNPFQQFLENTILELTPDMEESNNA